MKDKLAGLVLPDATPVETLEEVPEKDKKRRLRRPRLPRVSSDWLIAGCGIGLAAVCALFPWYIFLHQEKFGIRPLTFSGQADGRAAPGLAASIQPLGERLMPPPEGRPQLDFFPTGTVPDAPRVEPGDLPRQPFPGDRLSFRLIDAGNGRAMIEDEEGFWIVQHGSPLPDGSRVARIVEREGSWVLITSRDTEVRLER